MRDSTWLFVERTPDVSTRIAGLSVLLMAVFAGGAAAQSPSMDGVWRSQGYGKTCSRSMADAERVRGHEHHLCCRRDGSRRHDARPGRRDVQDSWRRRNVRPRGPQRGPQAAAQRGSASDERIDRIPRLPAVCEHPTESTPAGNFEVFAQTWAEHYISSI